jgi:hypothetical protein
MRATAVSPPEGDLLARVLRFANLPRIGSTTQIERLFRDAALVQAGGVLKVIEPENVAAYRNDQGTVRAALAAIASGDVAGRQSILRQADQKLGDTVSVRLGVHDGRLVFGYRVDGVLAACWLAIALLLDDGRGLTNRLGQCGAPGCERFNLTFTGRPRRHCSETHRLAFAAITANERVRRSRARARRRSPVPRP